VLVIVANAAVIWARALRAGSLPTTEVPAEPSRIVAPSSFVATSEEKAAVAAWEAEQAETVGGRR
jgi:carbon starvation protein